MSDIKPSGIDQTTGQFRPLTTNDTMVIAGEALIQGKADIGQAGTSGGLDVGEGGSTILNLVVYFYDASAVSGSSLTLKKIT